MCNAWNHSPGCTCGWGGVGHLGGGHSGTYSHYSYGSAYSSGLSIAHTYESFVNPNASCPVCGAAVFFYQSSNGGKVFFDELGPPWPRHPCTDNREAISRMSGSSEKHSLHTAETLGRPQTSEHTLHRGFVQTTATPARISLNPTASQRAQPNIPHANISAYIYAWQREGWQPFFILLVYEVDRRFLKIGGTLAGKDIALYARKANYSHGQINPITKDCIAHLRQSTENQYQLSLVTVFGNIYNVNAFTLLTLAHQDGKASPSLYKSNSVKKAQQSQKGKQKETPAIFIGMPQNKKEKTPSLTLRSLGKRPSQVPRKQPSETSSPKDAKSKVSAAPISKKPEVTAMSLAFAAAKKKMP